MFSVIFYFGINIWCYGGYCCEKINNKTRVYDLDDKYIYGFRDSKIQIIEINDYKNMNVKSIICEKDISNVNINVFNNKLFLSGVREESGKYFLDVSIYNVHNKRKPFKVSEFSVEGSDYLFNENNGFINLLSENKGKTNIISINLNNEKNFYSINEFDCKGVKFMYALQDNLYIVCDESVPEKKLNIIYKFNISNGSLNYINKVNVDGDIVGKKFIDEYMGNLRIITSCDNEKNKVYVLNKDLEIINFIEDDKFKNINNIYFDKNICYISSFLVDGYLLAYDLSGDNFREIGMMKLPSLVNLIYKVDDGKMVVIGNESRGNTYKNLQSDNVYEIVKNVGIKVMLIDIKKMDILDCYLIKGKQIYSPCFIDESKLVYLSDKNILIFPIDISNYNNYLDINSIMEVNNSFYNYDNFFNGIYGFNLNSGIDIKFIVDNYKEFKIVDYLDIEFMDILEENLFVFTKDCLKIFDFNGESLGRFDFKNS